MPADRYFDAAPEVRAAIEKRVQANAQELARHGEPRTGPTPAERFHARRPIEPEEREAFQGTLDAEITNMLETHKEQSSRMPTCSEQAAIERLAVQRALCEHGYLKFRRGRLSTPIQTWRAVTKA